MQSLKLPLLPNLRWLYLGLPAALVGGMLCVQAALMAIDPYSQYPWSPPREIPEEAQSGSLAPYFLNAVTRVRYDTVLVGGSTLRRFRPHDVVEILPNAGKPVNLSYSAPRPADLDLVLNRVLEIPGSRHLIVSLDYTYLLPKTVARDQFPFWIYTNSIRDRFLATDSTARDLGLNLVRRGELGLGRMAFRHQDRTADKAYQRFRAPAEVRRFSRMIESRRASVLGPAQFDCGDLEALEDVFLPFVRKAVALEKQVDVLFPAYSLAFYFFVNQPGHAVHGNLRPTIADHLMLRGCALQALDGLPGVRVFAFDGDTRLVGDLGNYYDTGHLYQMELYRYMLREIATGGHQLTLANFPGYAEGLRRAVAGYSYHNSAAESGRP